jgi:hypothetical protein
VLKRRVGMNAGKMSGRKKGIHGIGDNDVMQGRRGSGQLHIWGGGEGGGGQ